MKKYKLVKNALAFTMSLVLLTQVTGCGNKVRKDVNENVKLENENGEQLVVMTLIDKLSNNPMGKEKYGYIDSDLTFHSAISDYTLNLHTSGNTNCDVYYTNYVSCLSEEELDKIITNNEVLLNEIRNFESSYYVLSKMGAIKITDGDKEIRMDKFDAKSYFKDDDETVRTLSKVNG